MDAIEKMVNRFDQIKFESTTVRDILSPVMSNIEHFENNGKGNEFNAILLNVASAFPVDQHNIFSLFDSTDKNAPQFKRSTYLKQRNKTAATPAESVVPCDSCPDDVQVRWGDYKKMTVQERTRLGLDPNLAPSALKQFPSGGIVADKKSDEYVVNPDIHNCKTVQDVIEFFNPGNKKEYATTVLAMISFAETAEIDVGNKRKLDSIAKAILDGIKS